jgi:small-conductance mechanosensitive channel
LVQDRGTRLILLLVVIVAVLAAWWVTHYWLLRRYGRDMNVHNPTLHRRLVAALVEGVTRVLLPVLAVVLLTIMVFYVFTLGHELMIIVNRLAIAALQFVIIIGLSAVTLSPRCPRWRMTAFTDEAATRLDRALWLFAGTAFLVYLVMAVSGVPVVEPLIVTWLQELHAPAELSAVVGMAALLVLGTLLLNVLRPGNWRFVDADTDPPSTGPPSAIYRLMLNLARAGLIVSIIAGVLGHLNFGLFVSKRIVWTLVLLGFAWLIHGLVAAGTKLATSEANAVGAWVRQRLGLGDAGGARLVFWMVLLADVLLFLAVCMMTLLIWGMPWTEVKPIFTNLADGIEIGDFVFSISNVAIAIIVFISLAIGIRLLQRLLSNRILVQTSLDIGVRDALTSGVGYVGIFLAVLVTFSVLGLNLSELAIIFGALSVGIGFGLQHTVNNFVSGLILLIQRPIKAGDWIVLGTQEGYVTRINVISTEIQTFDNASLIVPNSNLVTSEVVNWMHKDKVGRVIIPVGVSYGSDPERVREVLLKCVDGNTDVLNRPAPQVIFREFGNSSLDFELRFYIRDVDRRLRTASDLRFAIKKAFDEAGIEIPFPQRDIHTPDVRSGVETTNSEQHVSPAAAKTGITHSQGATQGGAPEGDDQLGTKD